MPRRYKVRTPSDKVYREIYAALQAENVPVFVASEKRRVISTGSIPAKLLSNIRECGATVSDDQQYAAEVRRRA
jgi:hypothetical protein